MTPTPPSGAAARRRPPAVVSGRPWRLARAGLALLVLACGDGADPAPDDGPAEPAGPAPDVVLVVIDTLRADRLGCYGYDRPTSPTLDGLAAGGARFVRNTSQASWTAPSMISLFTSRHLGGNMLQMPELPTLAERLGAAGYRTVGLQFNILLRPGKGFERGFDEYELEPGARRMVAALDAPGDDRPLFAYVHYVDPHTPYAPAPQHDVFAPRSLPPERVARLRDYLAGQRPELDAAGLEQAVGAAADEIARNLALYDGDVLQADAKVRWLLERLDELRRDRPRLVVVTSDHGEGLWDHAKPAVNVPEERRGDPLEAFKMGHRRLLFEELVHVPLILHGPGVPAGVVVDGVAENTDIVPTLFDLAGLEAPRDVVGRSLLPNVRRAARGEPPEREPPAFANSEQYTAARTAEGRKVILPWDGQTGLEPMFFDLRADPEEQARLSGDEPGFAELLAAVRAYRERALRPDDDDFVIDAQTRADMAELGYLEDH